MVLQMTPSSVSIAEASKAETIYAQSANEEEEIAESNTKVGEMAGVEVRNVLGGGDVSQNTSAPRTCVHDIHQEIMPNCKKRLQCD